MCSVQALREFINGRLTAAAGEIFTVFEQTIVQYEEEIDRQRRLLDISWKPPRKFHTADLPEQHVCKEEQLCEQERNSSLDQAEPDPPQIKEEQEELGTSQPREQLVVVTVSGGENDHSEKLRPHNSVREFISGRLTAAAGEIFTVFEQTIVQYEEEIDRQRRLLDISWKPPRKFHTADLPQENLRMEEQLCDQERISSLDQEEPDSLQIKEDQEDSEPPQIKEELFTSQEGERRVLMQETDFDHFMETPVSEQSDDSEPDGGRLHSQISAGAENQNQKRNLMSHTTTLTGERPHRCETCGKGFRDRKTLSRHRIIHADEKPYSCETCGKGFCRRNHLLRHMRTHTGEKPFSCETCGKCFSQQSNLLFHMRTHTGEKPYSCETCGKCFCHQSTLLRHSRTHTGEKPYSCEVCGKRFSQQGHLLYHMTAHTGEKPYSCEMCGKSFSHQGNFMRHMRTHTGEKSHS